MLKFYADGLRLPVVESFSDHYGYNGTMLGLPGKQHHLEIINSTIAPETPCPNKDNDLVFYFQDIKPIKKIESRLNAIG
ncbi:MAG: hypothetical protein GKR94_07515 [Gammaproteobacteria bacterium]|nr:hypothetical protein [Gammaproteobacteria bacterium]